MEQVLPFDIPFLTATFAVCLWAFGSMFDY